MSDAASPDNAPKPEPKPDDSASKKGGGPLRVILFVLLAVMLGLGLLEIYSRTASSAAFKKVEEWVDDADRKGKATPEKVHELLGRKPDNGLEDMGEYYQEVYSWRRGRLYDTNFVKILYKKDGEHATLYEVVKNVDPKDGDIPRATQPEGDPVPGGLAGEAGGELPVDGGSGEEPDESDDAATDGNDDSRRLNDAPSGETTP